MEPLVSVIIPAHNEERFIGETITSVFNQTYKNIEIIVVNDGSVDKTERIVKDLMKTKNKIKLISFTKGHSAAFARNSGAKAAKGKILVFQDADCIPDKECVSAIVNGITAGYDGVASRTLYTKPKTLISKAIAAQRSGRWETFEEKQKEISYSSGILVANMKKSVFNSLGGFDDSIFYFEDDDFTRRFFEKGYKAVYDPKSKQYHNDPDTLKETIGQAKSFGKGIAWKLKKGQGIFLLIFPIYSFLLILSLFFIFFNYIFLITFIPLILLFFKTSIQSKDPISSLVFMLLFVLRNLIKGISTIKNYFF